MRRIAPLLLAVVLVGCGFDLAQARSILDSVTKSPLYAPARDCVEAGVDGDGTTKSRAHDVGKCLVGRTSEPVPSDAEIEQIGERAIALERQVSQTEAAIDGGEPIADELARGCRTLKSELEAELEAELEP